MSANKAITILSGGLDSMVSTAVARLNHRVMLALTFDYGQRAAHREIEAAGKLCKLWKISHEVIKLPWLKKITDTALVNTSRKLPIFNERTSARESERTRERALRQGSGQAHESARTVWVPNRNAIFINIAAAFAETLGANFIIAGFNKEEAATFPDNSKEFVASMNKTLNLGTWNGGALKRRSPETFADRQACNSSAMKRLPKGQACNSSAIKRLCHETFADRQTCNGEAMKHLPPGKYGVVSLSNHATLQVVSYTQEMTKRDIVKYATKNALPIALCWSCYEGGKKLCGKCESCVRFFRATKRGDL